MNIIEFSKTLGRFTLSLDIIGGLVLGLGFSFYPNVVAFGFSVGPLVFSVGYRKVDLAPVVPAASDHATHVCLSADCGRS